MCPDCRSDSARYQRIGYFFKASTRAPRIQRYLCLRCGRSFSDQTGKLTYRERKPHVDQALFRLLASGVSQRRAAEILSIHRITVARKLVRLGRHARLQHEAFLKKIRNHPESIVFDEMETFEHTKLKPLSIFVVVEDKTRVILDAKVARMPAKGLLADRSRRKYGRRADDRSQVISETLSHLAKAFPHVRLVKSDECPRYPHQVMRAFPSAEHKTYKRRRACVVGQGELKAGGRDPLFSLNHSCAMFRDNVKTLSRRTWCTVKRPDRLQGLLNLYICFHNTRIMKNANRPKIDEYTIK